MNAQELRDKTPDQLREELANPVSYTHLTLPTMLMV